MQSEVDRVKRFSPSGIAWIASSMQVPGPVEVKALWMENVTLEVRIMCWSSSEDPVSATNRCEALEESISVILKSAMEGTKSWMLKSEMVGRKDGRASSRKGRTRGRTSA